MFRVCKYLFALGALVQSVASVAAHERLCWHDECLRFAPPYHAKRLHNFRPGPWDGMPMIDSFHTDPTDFHGVGCIWSRRPAVAPSGWVWDIGRDCWRY
jgi:hypothetical protein